MADNVATYAGADFAACGADLIVGIGGGWFIAHASKLALVSQALLLNMLKLAAPLWLMAHENPGDIVKALAFGADFVMLGGIFAGTGPTPGEVITEDGSKSEYRGMGLTGGLYGWHHARLENRRGVAEVPYREIEEAECGYYRWITLV